MAILHFKGILQWNNNLVNASGDLCDGKIGHRETHLDQTETSKQLNNAEGKKSKCRGGIWKIVVVLTQSSLYKNIKFNIFLFCML